MDKYTFSLMSLISLSDEEFQSIPECSREVYLSSEARNLNEIATKEQAWLYELLKSISPDKESSTHAARPYPKYIPEKAIKIGGEALLIRAWDQWQEKRIALKIPRPNFEIGEKKEHAEIKSEGKPQIVRGHGLFKKIIYRKLEPPKEKREVEKNQFEKIEQGEKYQRFHRSFMLQEQLHRIACRVDPHRNYGYIPKTHEFGFAPRCYAAMEWSEGGGFVEYVKSHNDSENFDLFLKLTIFIEKVLHSFGVAHCDLAPRNILVEEDTPILLDFGIAKAPKLPDITIDSAQLGSLLYSSTRQLRNAKERGYLEDIFSLGRILWVAMTRREPALEGVIFENEAANLEEISTLFDKHFLHVSLRDIFEKSQKIGYNDISEFRAELEGLFLNDDKKINTECTSPCKWLREMDLKTRDFMKKLME